MAGALQQDPRNFRRQGRRRAPLAPPEAAGRAIDSYGEEKVKEEQERGEDEDEGAGGHYCLRPASGCDLLDLLDLPDLLNTRRPRLTPPASHRISSSSRPAARFPHAASLARPPANIAVRRAAAHASSQHPDELAAALPCLGLATSA